MFTTSESALSGLFDCAGAIEPKTRMVVVADSLKGSSYAKIAGKVLRPPKDAASGPSQRNLQKRYDTFQSMHGHKVAKVAVADRSIRSNQSDYPE